MQQGLEGLGQRDAGTGCLHSRGGGVKHQPLPASRLPAAASGACPQPCPEEHWGPQGLLKSSASSLRLCPCRQQGQRGCLLPKVCCLVLGTCWLEKWICAS